MSVAMLESGRGTAENMLDEVAARHPDVPRLIILKTDVQRRGVHYTEAALDLLDPRLHQVMDARSLPGGLLRMQPESLLLRDGTSIIASPVPLEQNPYWVDEVGGQLWLRDGGDPLEAVEYWPRPDYYGRKTAEGLDYRAIVSAQPQSLCIFPHPQKSVANKDQRERDIPLRWDPRAVAEVIAAAIREPGRFSTVVLHAAFDPSGVEPFDREVDDAIEILQAIGQNFKTPRFPSQLVGTAFTERQLARLHTQTGLMSYTANLEVLDERLFDQICIEKARWVDYLEWKRRLVAAASIFGRGRVNTSIVAGLELEMHWDPPSEEVALARNLEEAQWLAERGVTTVFSVQTPRPGSPLAQRASLDYHIRLVKGFHAIRLAHGLSVDFDDYRRGGSHPDTDLARLLH